VYHHLGAVNFEKFIQFRTRLSQRISCRHEDVFGEAVWQKPERDCLFERRRFGHQVPKFVIADNDSSVLGRGLDDKSVVISIHPHPVDRAGWRVTYKVTEMALEKAGFVDMIVSEVCRLAPLRDVHLDSGSLVAALKEIIHSDQNPATRKTVVSAVGNGHIGAIDDDASQRDFGYRRSYRSR